MSYTYLLLSTQTLANIMNYKHGSKLADFCESKERSSNTKLHYFSTSNKFLIAAFLGEL